MFRWIAESKSGLVAQLDQVLATLKPMVISEGWTTFYRDAMEMVTSDRAQKAFHIQSEDPKIREKYGRNDVGQSYLLARNWSKLASGLSRYKAGGGWDKPTAITSINSRTTCFPKY